ncbi:exodeoxyribonuclease VII small subunit [Flavobacterium suzhouense]|uniref:Exodeoxyribonuclease VII small subunit n=1 Tax=Flavobacterium suzhouense TaxID=1529638 RepID=A0ABW5NUU0_9FLAO
MEQNQITYEQAYNELTEITREIENESISVDELALKVKRASELISICQAKLRAAESEVSNIISQMNGSHQKETGQE